MSPEAWVRLPHLPQRERKTFFDILVTNQDWHRGRCIPADTTRSDVGCDDGTVLVPVAEVTSNPAVEERTTETKINGMSFAPSRRWRLDTPHC